MFTALFVIDADDRPAIEQEKMKKFRLENAFLERFQLRRNHRTRKLFNVVRRIVDRNAVWNGQLRAREEPADAGIRPSNATFLPYFTPFIVSDCSEELRARKVRPTRVN